jgi:hypothetical protein
VGHRERNGRILVAALAATGTVALFIPAIFTRDLIAALPYLIAAALCLSAQNPPIDAARLDIMPAPLWGRTESIRTLLRSFAQALAPCCSAPWPTTSSAAAGPACSGRSR